MLRLSLAALCIAASALAAEPDHSLVPGVAVDHSPASSEVYLGSPSLAKLDNGDLLISRDLFGPGSSYDTAHIFRSRDGGASWHQIAELKGQFWSTLFTHRGALYIIGTSKRGGDCSIRRSDDGGVSWTEPRDEKTGLLLTGASYHCAPVPIVRHKGRLWRAMEDANARPEAARPFRAFMMSVPEEADLLDASNWTASNRLEGSRDWLGGKFTAWFEGNAVVTPAGEVVNILRVDYRPEGGKAAVINISDDGRTATFDPKHGFIDFPGGCKKFVIRYDEESKKYWALSNYIRPQDAGGNPERTRNTLALSVSDDLRDWQVRSILLYDPDVESTGFQYPDWRFDGEDIIAAVRTAHADGLGGAHDCHDSNYITFHRFPDFRGRGMEDPPVNRQPAPGRP